jgi:hypothetical protein
MGSRKLLGQAVDVVEIAVRLVLVLLLELVVVKATVIETWGWRRIGSWACIGIGFLDELLGLLWWRSFICCQ